MYIFSKNKFYILLIIFLAAAAAFTAGLSLRPANNTAAALRHIKSLGWSVDAQPLEISSIMIPDTFDDVHINYNKLQLEAGFDLTRFSGRVCVRNTFLVKNFESAENVRINIIICDNKVIGGDISTVALDGFMLPLISRTEVAEQFWDSATAISPYASAETYRCVTSRS